MSVETKTAGYPVHRVTEFGYWVNPHRVQFLDWLAACGATGSDAGGRLGQARTARKRELCATCFPGQDMHKYYPEPVERRIEP